MSNPILPITEYIPDPEAHVFGNRVYLYGSHDKEGGDRFCMEDYSVWSADVNNLEIWDCHGVSYRKVQDPRSKNGKVVDYYAPDCVRGNDGRYYLYYFAAGPETTPFGPMSVAVSDKPEGPFEYLSDIQYKDGRPMMKYLTNDPAVINDNGRIYLYYGWGLGRDFSGWLLAPLYQFVLSKLTKRSVEEIKNTKPSVLDCAVVELENDMFTVKTEPKSVLSCKTTAEKGTAFYQHPFYEAPSIRKFGDLYYLIYSSGENNELAYAVSRYPDRDFAYKGVIISNSDLGFEGNHQRKAPAGTIHGSIEYINDKYYVFYHRCTNNTDFSRQVCVEPIEMLSDGSFRQVSITTQGVSRPLGAGKFPAAICCNLYNEKTKNVQGNGKTDRQPCITVKNGETIVTSIADKTIVSYKYFDFDTFREIKLTVRGDSGKIYIKNNPCEKALAETELAPSSQWKAYSVKLPSTKGIKELSFVYSGKGRIELLDFETR